MSVDLRATPPTAPAPARRNVPVPLLSVWVLMGAAAAFATLLLRGLAYICAPEPPLDAAAIVGVGMSAVFGGLGPALALGRADPERAGPRLAVGVGSAVLTGVLALGLNPAFPFFDPSARALFGALGAGFVLVPAAVVVALALELGLWLRRWAERPPV